MHIFDQGQNQRSHYNKKSKNNKEKVGLEKNQQSKKMRIQDKIDKRK